MGPLALQAITLTSKQCVSSWMGESVGTPGAADQTKAGLPYERIKVKKLGSNLFQGIQAQGKSGLCSAQLAGDLSQVVPQNTGPLNGARWCGAIKMALSCKEGTAAKHRRSTS